MSLNSVLLASREGYTADSFPYELLRAYVKLRQASFASFAIPPRLPVSFPAFVESVSDSHDRSKSESTTMLYHLPVILPLLHF